MPRLLLLLHADRLRVVKIVFDATAVIIIALAVVDAVGVLAVIKELVLVVVVVVVVVVVAVLLLLLLLRLLLRLLVLFFSFPSGLFSLTPF